MLEAVIWFTVYALTGLSLGAAYYALAQRLRGIPGYQRVRGYRVCPDGNTVVEY